jgi:hypothetical protein
MGVDVDERAKLRAGLEDILQGTRSSVAELIASINGGTFTQMANPPPAGAEAELNEWL